MPITSLVFAAAIAGTPPAGAPVIPNDYQAGIEAWHAARVERLRAPDGWLSLVGLPWLEPGANTVGSAADNDVVLPKGPAHLGTVTWAKDGTVTLDLAAGVDAKIDGTAESHAVLLDDSHDAPTVVSFGTTSFYLISRDPKKGLRIKDTAAATRTNFAGIERFPVDAAWRIEAKWIPFDPVHYLEVPTVIGTVDRYPVPGQAVFTLDGQEYSILPVIEVPGDKELFIMFADRTSGKETYGAARFLYAPMPQDGKLILDFNKAYNPPCAFTPYATCPLAPPENRLALRVTAGEKKYRGPGAH